MSDLKGFVGINNHNPLNVKQVPNTWNGSLGSDKAGHAIFVDPVYSIRAALRSLSNYCLDGRIVSLATLADIYAPASDGNNPKKYAAFLASRLSMDPTDPLE